jgi:hypothetical protein
MNPNHPRFASLPESHPLKRRFAMMNPPAAPDVTDVEPKGGQGKPDAPGKPADTPAAPPRARMPKEARAAAFAARTAHLNRIPAPGAKRALEVAIEREAAEMAQDDGKDWHALDMNARAALIAAARAKVDL